MKKYCKIHPIEHVDCFICKQKIAVNKNFIKCKMCHIYMHFESCGYFYQPYIQDRIQDCPNCNGLNCLKATINNKYYWSFL